MPCPKYVDNQRMCIKETGVLPADTLAYCATEKYVECPFYKMLEKTGPVCEFALGCQAFQHLQVGDFDEFVRVALRYCLSPGNVDCKRYRSRKAGKKPPSHLHPDGRSIEEWKEKS